MFVKIQVRMGRLIIEQDRLAFSHWVFFLPTGTYSISWIVAWKRLLPIRLTTGFLYLQSTRFSTFSG